MGFKMTPHVLNRIEFRRVSRKAFQDDALSSGGDVMFDQKAAMDRRTIPKDQQFARDVPSQVPEKLNDLWAFDAALMNLKVKPPQGQSADYRKAFPIEGFTQDGGLPARRPSADSCRAGAQPAFIDEYDGASLPAGFFLKRATPPVASGEWLFRRVPRLGALVSGS
jgi:hypothetical protein